jgi:hypothetical protein
MEESEAVSIQKPDKSTKRSIGVRLAWFFVIMANVTVGSYLFAVWFDAVLIEGRSAGEYNSTVEFKKTKHTEKALKLLIRGEEERFTQQEETSGEKIQMLEDVLEKPLAQEKKKRDIWDDLVIQKNEEDIKEREKQALAMAANITVVPWWSRPNIILGIACFGLIWALAMSYIVSKATKKREM